mmetsp:Transcript_70594/g.142143  ORF Transcript_70594/g.142143 Transcript_70594/m.142143 type:complete len:98 (-) Transcript_70594:173-466(-)
MLSPAAMRFDPATTTAAAASKTSDVVAGSIDAVVNEEDGSLRTTRATAPAAEDSLATGGLRGVAATATTTSPWQRWPRVASQEGTTLFSVTVECLDP